MIFDREYYLQKLIQKQRNGLIKIVTGLRRAGKSFLLFDLFKNYLLNSGYDDKHIICINFDGEEYRGYRNSTDAYSLIKSKINENEKFCILLDEVQYVDDFVPMLNSILHMYNIDCYVTGSNSKFLSKDVVTEFRGRGDEIHLYPLSFAELLSKYDNKYRCLEDYILYGGLPIVCNDNDVKSKSSYLKNIFKETYIIDIIERYGIRKSEELDNLVNILSSGIGSLSSIKNIVNTFKSVYGTSIDINTIKSYIEILKDIFLINEVERYDIKGRKYIGAERKYYFEDIGLRNARIGFRQIDRSHIMENIIYNELVRRRYDVDMGIVNKKVKSKDTRINRQYEVDFIAELGYKKYYIQSVYSMDNEKKRTQELESLKLVGDSFKKFIIRYDNEGIYIDNDGIINIGFFDFLLNEDCFSFD